MQTSDLDHERLRALAATRPERGRVLSLYLNLDPSEFATPSARRSGISSLLDDAHREIEGAGCDHAVEQELRGDLQRARDLLEDDPPMQGAHGLALFLCAPAGLFEVVVLPRPVRSCVSIDTTPLVEPLAELLDERAWGVLLINRRIARFFRGTRDRLTEVVDRRDDVPGQHREGGLSQPRYERSIEEDVGHHLRAAAEQVFQEHQRRPLDALLLASTEELAPRVEAALHPYLRERLAGRLSIDVEVPGPDEVLAAAQPAIEAKEREKVEQALSRLRERIGAGGRATAGWDDVLGALNERRVEALLLADGTEPGVRCPQCGWLGRGAEACPLDGTAVERHASIAEQAVEAALGQSAEVVRVEPEDLAGLGGVGAVLRF
jgi:peptide chain release factor subunit 1